MADIAPFRAVRYDTSKCKAEEVLAPPYDVIDDVGRAELVKKSSHNCIELILPAGDGDAKYAHAAELFDAWQQSGVLVRDDRPSIYRYHQIFTSAALGGAKVTRRGFIAAVRLHEFDERVILPHERTLKGPKIDRLKLMDAASAHFSQIFTMYGDPSGETDNVFKKVERTDPDLEGVTDDGTLHRLWRVDDSETIGSLKHLMAPLKLYIADGHHRYETMLALREKFRERGGGDLGRDSAAEYGTMFLANMNDSGLVVLPTHRIVHSVDNFSADDLIEKASEFFFVEWKAGMLESEAAMNETLSRAGASTPALAVAFPGNDKVALLTLRGNFDAAAVGITGPKVVQRLDVTLLHSVLFEHILGITKQAQEAKTNLRYFKSGEKALEAIKAGEGQAAFFMNATPVEQVKAVSDAGEVMPQKSTFFYPKIASGVLFTKVDPSEAL